MEMYFLGKNLLATLQFGAQRSAVAILFLLAVLRMGARLYAADYFVAQQDPRAADSNPGTVALSFKTLSNACAKAVAGDTVYIKAGTYREALIPKNSGTRRKPITFQAYHDDFVMIKGSEVLTGLVQTATNIWVKRPWHRENYWNETMRRISSAPYQESARVDQVFVNESPLQWVPTRKDLRPGCFVWDMGKNNNPSGGELVICPPAGIADLNRALVEIPLRSQVLCAWEGDPSGIADVRHYRQYRPELMQGRTYPEVNHIHIRNLHFRHNADTLNRAGVRLDGDDWLLEQCTIEYMNCVGVAACGDHDVVRRCSLNYNGQIALTASGADSLFEDCITLFNNRKRFSISWGGGGNKICVVNTNTVRRLLTAFNAGPGLWYDIDCQHVLVEDCLSFGNAPVNGDFMYEISRDAIFRRNISLISPGGQGGLFISDSASTCAEDNVLIGNAAGVSIGAGRRGRSVWRSEIKTWTACSNTVQRNLIVEPSDCAYKLSRNEMFDAALSAAGNRFLDNTVLARYGSRRVRFGFDEFDTPEAYDGAISLGRNNRSLADLAQLDRRNQARLNAAFKRVLNALPLADARLDFNFWRVSLEQIWSLEADVPIIGYWLKADGQRILIVEVPSPGGTVQVLDSTARTVTLWEFSGLGPAQQRKLHGEEGLFTARTTGFFLVLTGLSPAAQPVADTFNVRAEIDGQPVATLAEGKAFTMIMRLSNPFDVVLPCAVRGPALKGEWRVLLPPHGAVTTNLALTASKEQNQYVYELACDRLATNRRVARVPVTASAVAPYWREITVDPACPNENSRLGLIPLKINTERQLVRDRSGVRAGTGWVGPQDLSAKVWCGWNEKALYILAEVQDAVLARDHGAKGKGAGVKVFLDGRVKNLGKRACTSGTHHFSAQAPVLSPVGDWQPVRWEGDVSYGVCARGGMTTNGYVIETAIDWKLFPEIKPIVGAVLGLDIALDGAVLLRDGQQPVGGMHMAWHGTEGEGKDANLFGQLKLISADEVDFGTPLRAGDIIARDAAGRFAIVRTDSGHPAAQVLPTHVEGRLAGSFVGGGFCFDAGRNLYFLDGPMNFRLQVLPAGATRSQIIYEYPHLDEQENPYYFGVNLIAVGQDAAAAEWR